MAYYFTSADLIASVKRRASIPDSQSMITDDEILDFANEEMQLNLVPFVMSKHEDYYIIREEVDVEANRLSYPIPYRAMGNKINELCYRDANDNSLVAMTRISLDEYTKFYSNTSSTYNSNAFHIESENVVIDSTDSSFGHDFLVFIFNLRPNQLVDSARISIITAIDSATGQITVSSIPDNFTASSQIDLVKTNSPHRILTYDIGLTAIDIANNVFTIDADDIPNELAVGDRICLSNETDVVNAPSSLHVMLAEMVAARVLESIGDTDNLQAVNDKLNKMEKRAETLIDNRVTGSPIKASARTSLLRGRRLNRFNK